LSFSLWNCGCGFAPSQQLGSGGLPRLQTLLVGGQLLAIKASKAACCSANVASGNLYCSQVSV